DHLVATAVDHLGVLTSTRGVVERSRYVHVDEAAIAAVAPGLSRRVKAPEWYAKHHFVDGTEKTAGWLLALDALNFSFWGEPRWRVQVDGETRNGYSALAASLKRAMESGVPLADARFLSGMSMNDLAEILSGEGVIPMLDRRLENLHEVGEVLLAKYGGSF